MRQITASWPVQPEITVGAAAKWKAFAEADAAVAASGTVILELALAGIPVVSTYKADWIIRLMHKRIKIWTAAIPNLVADYAIVPEYLNEAIRAGALSAGWSASRAIHRSAKPCSPDTPPSGNAWRRRSRRAIQPLTSFLTFSMQKARSFLTGLF